MSDLTKSLTELNAALEAATKEAPQISAAIKVEDELGRAQKYLSEKANKALAKSSKELIVTEQRFLGRTKVFKCVYFGVRVAQSQIEVAVMKLSEMLNALAEKDKIHSALAPMISLELVRSPGEVPTVAVCSYVLVPENFETEAKKWEFSMDVGAENLKTVGDVKMELKDGEVLAVIRISHGLSLIKGAPAAEDRLQQEIDAYLKVLPEGTVHVSTEQLPITDLSVQHEVKFYNPLLQQFKRVELGCVRACAVIDDKLEQFNLLTSVHYFDKDGKEVYGRQN